MIKPKLYSFQCGLEDSRGRITVRVVPTPARVAPYPHSSAMVHEARPTPLPSDPMIPAVSIVASFAISDCNTPRKALAQHLAEIAYYERRDRQCP